MNYGFVIFNGLNRLNINFIKLKRLEGKFLLDSMSHAIPSNYE